MKKIAFIIPQIGKGGAERVAVNLANQLARRGYKVSIYTILSDERNYNLDDTVAHIYLGDMGSNRIGRVIKRFFRLYAMLREAELDVIIAFDRTYGVSCGLLSGKRVIASERNDPYSNMGMHSFEKKYRDYVYKKAHMVVFQTEYARAYFDEEIRHHSCIIPNPVSSEVLPDPYLGEREKTVVTACRLTEQKNIPMMLSAFAQFFRTHSDYRLILYGEGHLKKHLVDLSRELGIAEAVTFAGYTEQLPEKIVKSGMYISSSDYEGISNAMLEAMAMGIPTICTDCPAGGAAMAIEDQVNGLLVPVGDSAKLCNAMCKVANDSDFAGKMGQEAYKIRERFNVQKITEMWEEVL